MRVLLSHIGLTLVSLTLGCSDGGTPGPGAGAGEQAAPITNRVEVPAAVRQSLGITFARAEERQVSRTLRLPCSVDSAPGARRPFHSSVAGTLAVHVEAYAQVEAGQLLATVVSPELLERRHELHAAGDAVGEANDALQVDLARLKQANANLAHVRQRLKRLRGAGTTVAELEAKAAALESSVDFLTVQGKVRRRALVRAEHRFEAELAGFAARVGVSVDELRAGDSSSAEHGASTPRWETLQWLEIRADQASTVSALPLRAGAWVERGELLVELTDPSSVQIACRALTSDLGTLETGQRVVVVPSGRSGNSQRAQEGTLRLGVAADHKRHTLPAIVSLDEGAAWLRPGVAVFADVVVGGGAAAETAVPVEALVRDGLETVLFVRDPANADKVIRVAAELGVSDGRWTVIFGGVAPGDEVVLDGAYELKLASTRKPDVVGHFHADGTFHEGKD